MTCPISKQIAEYCDEPRVLICPECGSDHGTINHDSTRFSCDSCGNSYWYLISKDGLELIKED